jgi:hypothetical protein
MSQDLEAAWTSVEPVASPARCQFHDLVLVNLSGQPKEIPEQIKRQWGKKKESDTREKRTASRVVRWLE